MSDQIRVGASTIGRSWEVTIDLDSGEAREQRGQQRSMALSAALVARARRLAAALHAGGDLRERAPMADGVVYGEVTLGGEAVCVRSETWGGEVPQRLKPLWDLVQRLAWP